MCSHLSQIVTVRCQIALPMQTVPLTFIINFYDQRKIKDLE